jgi:hypothetical protein
MGRATALDNTAEINSRLLTPDYECKQKGKR